MLLKDKSIRKSKVKAVSKSKVKSKSIRKAKSKSIRKAKSKSIRKSKSKSKSIRKSKSKAKSKAKSKSIRKSKSKSKLKSKSIRKSKSKAKSIRKSKAKSKSKSKSKIIRKYDYGDNEKGIEPKIERKKGESRINIIEKSPDEKYGKEDIIIGRGSYKIVYKGINFETLEEIAWSCINLKNLTVNEKKNIKNEADLLNKMAELNRFSDTNNHIVKLNKIWFNKIKKEIVILTELIDGGSLQKFLEKYRNLINLSNVKSWAKQIIIGLLFLHSNGVIHRDLKLDNILINPSTSEIYLTDFGLSTMESDLVTGEVGSLLYMAPETLKKDYLYNNSIDMYSFGICLLEMLTKEMPYNEYSFSELLEKKSEHTLPLPLSLKKVKDNVLVTLIKNLLSYDPDERPTAYNIYISEIF